MSEVVESYADRVAALLAQGRQEEASALAGAELDRFSDPFAQVRLRLETGDVAWSAGFPGLAKQFYKAGLAQVEPLDAPALLIAALLRFGLSLYDAGDHAGGLALYERAEDLDPGTDPAQTHTINMRIVTVLIDEGRYAEASARLVVEPPEGADAAAVFRCTTYRMNLAERLGDLDAALDHAGDIRDAWAVYGARPEFRLMGNAIVTALHIQAALRGPDAVADLRAEIVAFPEEDLGIMLRLRLHLLRAAMLEESGDAQGAIDALEAVIRLGIERYENLPVDGIVALHETLERAGRGGEAFDRIDTLWQGQLSADALPVADLSAELAGFLVTVLTIDGMEARAPKAWAAARQRSLALAFDDAVPRDVAWRLCVTLARLDESAGLRTLLAKRACQLVLLSAESCTMFPSARRRYATDRQMPFALACELLFDQGRVSEARALSELAITAARIGPDMASQAAVPWLPTERQAIDVATADTGGDLGPSLAAILGSSAETPAVAASVPLRAEPLLRYVMAGDGIVLDASGAQGTRQLRIPVSVGDLSRAVAAVLAAAEAGQTDRDAATVLWTALVAPVADLIAGEPSVAICAAGPVAAVPFGLISPQADEARHWIYVRGTHRAQTGASVYDVAALIVDKTLDASDHEARTLGQVFALSQHELDAAGLHDALKGGADVMHLAGHFDLAGGDPVGAGIRTAQASLSPRRIAVLLQEIPPPSLVCLSLCDSGTAPVPGITAQDLPGLFLSAGARDVLATAWRVGDCTAARFAAAFYPALKQSGDVATAFRTARGETLGFMHFAAGS